MKKIMKYLKIKKLKKLKNRNKLIVFLNININNQSILKKISLNNILLFQYFFYYSDSEESYSTIY